MASPRARSLGAIESFFEAYYDTFGAYTLTTLFALSAPITLDQLQTCAENLRQRHRILQVTPRINWLTRDAYLQFAPQLRTHVVQYDGPLSVAQHVSVLTDGDLGADESDQQIRERRLAHRRVFLPWSLYLSAAGDHVAFVTAHSISDGAGSEIIGADIVRCLNGIPLDGVVEIAPTLEQMFGEITFWDRVQGIWTGISGMFQKLQTAGLDTTAWSRDYKTRRPVVYTTQFSMNDIERFHRKCRDEGVSLTSGMVSSFYEALGSRKELNASTTKLAMCIPMDARRRLPPECNISGSVGSYSGYCIVAEDGREGKWARRAKDVHAVVHGIENEVAFKTLLLLTCTTFLGGAQLFRADAYGDRFGRLYPLMTSNLGRAQWIDRANELVASDDGVRIERMRFDVSHRVNGAFFLLLVCTVGDCMSVSVKSYEPFVEQRFVDDVGMLLREKMMAA